MLLIHKRRDVPCLEEGKDMCYDCYDCFALTFLFALIFFSLSSPITQYHIQEERDQFQGKKISSNSLHIFTLWGHVYNKIEYLVLTLYMSSQSWYSCDFLLLLCLVGVCMLSNLVYSGSSLPKLVQDHKVSICITLMCMKISC